MDHIFESALGFLAGVNGGIATVYVGQPLDTIKVKMQTFPEVHKSAFKCFKTTLTKDGIARGLYAGTVPALAANIAENSVLFCALPPSQHLVACIRGKPTEKLNNLEHAFSGSLAAFWSSLTLCPTELVKCKVQSMREMVELGQINLKLSDVGPWQVTKTIFREEGLMGFTRGLVPTFAREMPGYFFFFGGYELSRSLIAGKDGNKNQLGILATAFCGGVGGMSLWAAIFPFDVVKSRVQVGHTEASSANNAKPTPVTTASTASAPPVAPATPPHNSQAKKTNLFRLLIHIARSEGVSALYRGLGPTLLRTFPASGALFVAVEWTKSVGHWLYD